MTSYIAYGAVTLFVDETGKELTLAQFFRRYKNVLASSEASSSPVFD